MRPDGYHDIDTIMCEVDLADQIEFRWTREAGFRLTVLEGDAPPGEGNLIVRAAKAAAGVRASGGLDIWLRKRIPVEAGLGGGSSNAAAAIAAVARLLGTDENPQEIAARIGSDVPFFLHGGVGRARGRGEETDFTLPALDLHMLIVKPERGTSTAWAYREIDRRGRDGDGRSAERVLDAIRRNDRSGMIASMNNDFEGVVFEHFPEVLGLRDRLLSVGAEKAMLCGSGSAVFGVFPSREQAQEAGAAFGGVWHAAASSTRKCARGL